MVKIIDYYRNWSNEFFEYGIVVVESFQLTLKSFVIICTISELLLIFTLKVVEKIFVFG